MRVFLTVDDPLLKTVEGFNPRKGMRLHSPRTKRGKLQLHGRNTPLEAGHVVDGPDGTPGIGQYAVASDQPAEGPGLALLRDGFIKRLHECLVLEKPEGMLL